MTWKWFLNGWYFVWGPHKIPVTRKAFPCHDLGMDSLVLELPCMLTAMEHHAYKPWFHDDVIKWKRFPRYWPFVRGIHRSPVNSPHKGQWRGTLFSLICAWINNWVNNREPGDLRRHCAHYDVRVMLMGNVPATLNGISKYIWIQISSHIMTILTWFIHISLYMSILCGKQYPNII